MVNVRRAVISSALLILIAGLNNCGGGSSSPRPPPPDFALSVSPTSATVPPGGVLVAQVSVTAENGFSGSVSVSVTGLPTGTTISPASPFTMSAGSQNVTLNLPSNSALGNFTVTFQGSSGSLQHSVSIALQVQTPDFALSVSPTSATVPPGGALLAQVSLAAMYGFTGSVSISVTGLPTGATISPPSPFTMSAGSQNVVLSLPSNSALGNFTVMLQGSSGSLQHSASIALQVQTQQFASFSVTLNNSELSFSQGSSANTIVGLSLTSSGNTNYEVEFSVTGLPSGVQATFGQNPFFPTQPATSLTFTASSTSGLANYATVTVTATRTADGVQESAQLEMNITPPVGTLPPIRTDFIREDGTPAAAVFDAVHNVVYASNTQWNRVDVISATTHQILNSIPAPNPTGMDMSLDGSHLIVTSNVQQIVSIDTSSLQVVQRTNVTPIVQGGASYSIPDLIANTSNGTALLGMTNFSDPPSYYLEQWNPATGSFTALSAPGVTAWINRLVRTGDGAKALVVDYGTDVNMAVYDATSNTFTASGQSPVGQVLGVAASPTAHQFAIRGTSGFAFLDSDLNVLATPQLGGYFFGMIYSADGTKLYVAMELLYTQCGPNYPVLLTYNTSTYALIGVAPAFSVPTGNPPCSPPLYLQGVPLAADNSGLVFSNSGQVGTGYTEGLLIDDAANFQNVLNLPVGPPGGGVGPADEAALNTPLATSLGQASFDVLPDIWFGNTRGTNIQFSTGPLVSVTAPPSATAGLVNVTGVLPDGWFFVVPQSFSYGSQILFMGGNEGSTQGGASLALIGYGLMGSNGTPTVTIGGHTASVTKASKYVDFNNSGNNAIYPFRDVDEVMVTVPPSSPGAANVTLTSSAGTSTLASPFTYLSVSDYSSSDTLTYVLYDPQRHWVYLAAGDHIDVFEADTAQFLTPIVPPSVSGARQIRGLALTPDNSKLLAANFADISVAIIDPDNPSSGTAVKIPVNLANSPGVADVVATSTGQVFVDGVSGTFSGCGGQVWELNLTTLTSTLRTDLAGIGLQVGGNEFSRSATGNNALLAGPGCGTFLWNSTTDTFTQSLAVVSDSTAASSDGYWYASDYVRLDAQMIQHMQAQVPEFFSASLVYTDLPGERLNAAGSVLYTPVPQGYPVSESGGVSVTDTNSGAWLGQILLSEQILNAPVQNTMDFDETGNRLFLITNKGLTLVELPNPPLSIGYLNPAVGSASGGTTVTIRGSGFESGATVSFGGTAASTIFQDRSTVQAVTPAGSAGGVRVSVQNPDGTAYSLDGGFIYQ